MKRTTGGPPKQKKKTGFQISMTSLICFGVTLFVLMENEKKNEVPLVRGGSKSNSSSSSSKALSQSKSQIVEDWRGAPVGDGEDTVDSYHSYDHRPPGSDPRDVLLKKYSIHRCPNGGIGTMVSGQDSRFYELNPPANAAFKERNPKFLCDVAKIHDSPHQPCVVYSFGSWDEISFEVGIDKVTQSKCDVHTFDPEKLPPQQHASNYHFTVHDMGIAGRDNGKFKTLSTIMNELGHTHIHVFKIDIEGHERHVLPNMIEEGLFARIDQVSIEFHSVQLMQEGLDILEAAGFNIVYARREDRCNWCTEVTLVKI